MPDTKSPIRGSASLAALKAAIMVEQRALELDIDTVRTRTDALPGEMLRATLPASAPIFVTSRERALLSRAFAV